MKKLLTSLLLMCLFTSLSFSQWLPPNQKPMLGVPINKMQPLSNPIAHWIMNGGAGGSIFDLSGNNLTGTFLGDTSWTVGKFGHALTFDGTDDAVDIIGSNAVTSPLNLLGDFTIVAWIKPTAFDGSIISKRSDADSQFQFFTIDGDGSLYFRGGAVSRDSGLDVPNNAWSFVGVSVVDDGIGGGIPTVYANGSSAVVTVVPMAYQNLNISIGSRWAVYPTPAFELTGQISHLSIYDYVLSPAEMRNLSAEPFIMHQSNYIDYWGSLQAGSSIATLRRRTEN